MSEVKKIATREAYGEMLAELGETYPNLVVLDADLAAATKTSVFKKKFPERHIDCGIAEANMMGMAAGLSLVGKIPVASTFAMFAAGRRLSRVQQFHRIIPLKRKESARPMRALRSARTARPISATRTSP